MDKYKKIIIILSVSCLIAIIISLILILILKKENDEPIINEKEQISKNVITENENNIEYVQEVSNTKITYNVGICINNMLKDYYYTGKYKNDDVLLLPSDLVKKMDYDNGLKSYYIERAYKEDLDDNITIYFTKGYLVNEKAEQINKEEIFLTFVSDTEYNTATIEMYGQGYTDKIKYNDDISKTVILDSTGFKIKKAESGDKQLNQILIDDEIYQNRNLDINIPERDLIAWYYKDYKIKQANESKQKLNLQGFIYEGNFNDGYTITEIDGTEYFIKPGQIPMEYKVEEK